MRLVSRTAPLSHRDWDGDPGAPRVLLVEDDHEMLRVLVRTLEKDAYRLTTFASADALLLALPELEEKGERPDLIVSDVRMPGSSGLDMLARVSALSMDVPVILISAFCDEETLGQASRLGAACVLSKPFDMDVLRSAVLYTLSSRRRDVGL